MKKGILSLAALAVAVTALLYSFKTGEVRHEYQLVTTVESIVPMGVGRSRIIMEQEDVDPAMFATERIDGHTSKQGNIRRSNLKAKHFEETKLLNFYSAVGINFQNIASNDAIVAAKLTQMEAEGWQLVSVSSAVESDAGKDDGQGIFITRYLFKREVKE